MIRYIGKRLLWMIPVMLGIAVLIFSIMYICPGVALREATQPTLAPGHHWAVTASVGSSIGMKGMIRIGKIMAIGTYEVMTHPEMVAAAKEEFLKATGGKPYECPITDDIPWPYKD